MSKNKCAKTRDVNEPYEVYRNLFMPDWEWRVLKKWQQPNREAENPYARWFCAVKSNMTQGGYDMGDVYVRDILQPGTYKIPVKGLEQW